MIEPPRFRNLFYFKGHTSLSNLIAEKSSGLIAASNWRILSAVIFAITGKLQRTIRLADPSALIAFRKPKARRLQRTSRILDCLDGRRFQPTYWGHSTCPLKDELEKINYIRAAATDVFSAGRTRTYGIGLPARRTRLDEVRPLFKEFADAVDDESFVQGPHHGHAGS